ncbi:hemolysin III family protein [Vagococcus coleopterorum]|uniref:Hemolysin III family protein n=1 Tax=Vagococcus coleopterorum TaxID=2714946 RepID=A0A6G8AQ17_9ENTE|nr:hemolysin III family protein [Vagococcus coleopterorum]QIL47013.1 hemolysin III family protein [Vagococcus coleopterorum]
MEKYSKKYEITHEVLNAVTHGIGFGLSVAGLVLLIVKGVQLHSPIHIVAYSIYGASLILLFLASTLFHSLTFTKAEKVFQVFDHSSIYLLIAGTYTPYCLLTIKGVLGWSLFIIIWLLAIIGIVYKSIYLSKKGNSVVILYILMGWLCLVAVKPLYEGLGFNGTTLLVAGGVTYSLGAIVYKFQQIKYMHLIWHFFVLAAAILMFFSIYLYT